MLNKDFSNNNNNNNNSIEALILCRVDNIIYR